MPFPADAIDARRLVAHQAVRVGADIRDADIVAPDDEDIGLAAGRTAGAGVGAAGGGCRRGLLACASAPEVIAAAATSADEPSRMLRRLRAWSSAFVR